MPHSPNWQPSEFFQFASSLHTSMGTSRIVTDVGEAYLKGMGNPQGPHHLACEWIGSQLADWFGLPTFDFAIMRIDSETDQIQLLNGQFVETGPAFVSRAIRGYNWSGLAEDLDDLEDLDTVSRLVVFDTWIRNWDRCPPQPSQRRPRFDNVFIAYPNPPSNVHSQLMAMDFSHCLVYASDLNNHIRDIENCRDTGVYGLFEGFRPHIHAGAVQDAFNRFREVDRDEIRGFVNSTPVEWELSSVVRNSIVDFLCSRASFLSDRVEEFLRDARVDGHLF